MKIAVGGMIASGKTTLVENLSKELGFPKMGEFKEDNRVFNTMLTWLYEGEPDVEMLLQLYFLHHHWSTQKEFTGNVIVDRHVIEHWLFAQTNLAKFPHVRNKYNGLFHAYMDDTIQPDLYIILDVDWGNFKKRLMSRGRESEKNNFEKNIPYFKRLIKDYTEMLKAQCIIYRIPYVVIDTNGLTDEEVLAKAKELIKVNLK